MGRTYLDFPMHKVEGDNRHYMELSILPLSTENQHSDLNKAKPISLSILTRGMIDTLICGADLPQNSEIYQTPYIFYKYILDQLTTKSVDNPELFNLLNEILTSQEPYADFTHSYVPYPLNFELCKFKSIIKEHTGLELDLVQTPYDEPPLLVSKVCIDGLILNNKLFLYSDFIYATPYKIINRLGMLMLHKFEMRLNSRSNILTLGAHMTIYRFNNRKYYVPEGIDHNPTCFTTNAKDTKLFY